MSRYGFDACSCGSSMLKPTESPPPSCAPRFAASITPGPPPVTTAQPRSAKQPSRPRAPARTPGCRSSIRAEPKIAAAGRSIRVDLRRSPRGTPPRSSRPRRRDPRPGCRGSAVVHASEAVLRQVRHVGADREAAAAVPAVEDAGDDRLARGRRRTRASASSATTAPPSRIPNGSRLNRLRKKPKYASAIEQRRSRAPRPTT